MHACDRDAAFCSMLVACKVIYNDYAHGEGRRLDGRCARGDSGRHLELQQAIALVTGGRLYMDARALVAVVRAEREGGRRAGGCCRLVRAVMALEPGAVHAPGRTGLLHWLYAQCRAGGRPKNVPEAHFCAELLFAGAAHVYLQFVQGTPVCECGGLSMCCYAACPGVVPDVPEEKPVGLGTACALAVAAERGALSGGFGHIPAHNTSGGGVVPMTPEAHSSDVVPATPGAHSPGVVPVTPEALSLDLKRATPGAHSPGVVRMPLKAHSLALVPATPGAHSPGVVPMTPEAHSLALVPETPNSHSPGVVPVTPEAHSLALVPETPNSHSPGVVPVTPEAHSLALVPETPNSHSPGVVPVTPEAHSLALVPETPNSHSPGIVLGVHAENPAQPDSGTAHQLGGAADHPALSQACAGSGTHT
jgi:hypothetical protein